MSTYILMKILESTPDRYDRGIRLLTLGRLDEAYDRLASHIKQGQKVLDIGCGTGALSLRAARRGAAVKGVDVNPRMLEIAQKRADDAGFHSLKFSEEGIAELDNETTGGYDVIMSGLCFSELTDDEIDYALREAFRLLKPGGALLLADETEPENPFKRLARRIIRFPLVIVTYLLTQTTTRPVKHLVNRILSAGFQADSLRANRTETFLEVVAHKPTGS